MKLSAEYIADLESRCDAFINDPPEDLKWLAGAMRKPGFLREVFKAGEWLSDRLREAGEGEQSINDLCYAHGQRTFGGKDPWIVAEASLQRFLNGQRDKPGIELAEKLFNGGKS